MPGLVLPSLTFPGVNREAGEELAPVFCEHIGNNYLMIPTDCRHSDAIDKFPDKTVADWLGE